jgi:hypothetical protein
MQTPTCASNKEQRPSAKKDAATTANAAAPTPQTQTLAMVRHVPPAVTDRLDLWEKSHAQRAGDPETVHLARTGRFGVPRCFCGDLQASGAVAATKAGGHLIMARGATAATAP